MGIIANAKYLVNFSSGELIVSDNNVKKRKKIYNSLVGPTEFSEFAEDIC